MISLCGKLTISIVTIAVLAGMSVVTYVIVEDAREGNDNDTVSEQPQRDIPYSVGIGISDMTGPCTEITFMGYGELGQSGIGIHLRQYARSFIFVKGNTRVVLVLADVQAVGYHVRRQVVRNLQAQYGSIYNFRNVIIAGTHTHSAPGGHLVDFLLDVSILGFSTETFEAYVHGITQSIMRAHEDIAPASLVYSEVQVPNIHKNRSPFSYQYNPLPERERYANITDDTLKQVRVVRPNGRVDGVMNWFAVHATSMNMTNQLISSDNLGYAAIKMEAELNPGSMTGKPSVIAAFFPANIGDVSPNTEEARCEFSGELCDNQFLLCATFERCFAFGPGEDMFESTKIIGEALAAGALDAMSLPGRELSEDLAVIHQFIKMEDEQVFRYDPVNSVFDESEIVGGCSPALGYSFASGTTDGANVLNITQGTLEGNPLLDAIGGIVAKPTEEDIICHAPKPIILATGRANFPLPWHPHTISASLIYLGGFAIAGIPGEPTTMTGRRVVDVVNKVLADHGVVDPITTVMGLTNEYIHYIATYEEYLVQRYEAASTIYGPHSLEIFLNKFREFASAALEGTDVPPGTEPTNRIPDTISLITPVLLDRAPSGYRFGDVLEQPPSVVRPGDVISAKFVAASPRNDLKHESTHGAIQRLEIGQWVTVSTDADWDTKFFWNRESTLRGTSTATFEWHVPTQYTNTPHRIVYFGAAKSILGTLTQFVGYSNEFSIVDS